MKKLLALVLALVMTMSLVTISNAAFKDADKISNKEAVDVMAAVGVLAGYDNGEFGATDTLTRAQACKIIAYLDLGKDVAEALPAVQVFSDLSANNWAAKYVAYCADAGYVSGVGDNKFAPDEKVTGYQFGKMLLCVLGYDQKVEEMTGSSWEIKVAKLMESNSLTKGTTKLGSAALTREEAAQYALNALKATCVEYDDKGTTIVGNGITITTGAKKAKAVTVTGETSANDYARKAGAASIGTQQLVEKLYSKTALTLYKDNTATNGQAGYTWKVSKNGVESSAASFVATETVIGSSYDNTAVYAASGKSLTRKNSTNAKYIAELNDDFNDADQDGTGYEVYVNGAKVTNTSVTSGEYSWDATNKVLSYGSPAVAVNGYGVLVELIDTDDDLSKAEKVYFTTYKVATVDKAPVVKTNTVDGKDYVYLPLTGASNIGTATVTDGVKAANVKGYEGLAKDDVVTVVAKADGTYVVNKLEAVVGKVTATASNSMTINGTATKIAKAADATITSYNGAWYSTDVSFFYDAYGYVVRAEEITVKSSDYLMILASQVYNDDFASGVADSNKSKVVFDDGTTATITVAKVDSYSWAKDTLVSAPANNDVYAYTKNDDGSYNLISGTYAGTNTNNGTTAITKGVSGDAKGTDKTKYILCDKNSDGSYKTSWTAYVGYKNVPSITTATTWFSVNNSDGYADVVFVSTYANVTSSTKDVVYLLSTSYGVVYDKDGSVDYYTMDAIVDGAKGVVKSTLEPTSTNLNADSNGLSANSTNVTAKNLYKVVYTDGELNKESMTIAPVFNEIIVAETGTIGIAEAKNGVVAITDNGTATAYNYAADAVVYVINSDADEVEVLDMETYDTDATYTKITLVTEGLGVTNPTELQKNTVTAIYLQK